MKLTPKLWRALGFVPVGLANHWEHLGFHGLYDGRRVKTVRGLLRAVARKNRAAGERLQEHRSRGCRSVNGTWLPLDVL
jgi:hypothetical protein